MPYTTEMTLIHQMADAMIDMLTYAQWARIRFAADRGGFEAGLRAMTRVSKQLAAEKMAAAQETAFLQGRIMGLQMMTDTPVVSPDAPTPPNAAAPLSPHVVPRVAVDSEAIVSIGFQRVAGTLGDLVIEFVGGAVYVYEDVPEWMHGELMRSASKGGYVNRKIKPIYDARLLID